MGKTSEQRYSIRCATPNDMETLLRLCEMARRIMRSTGNLGQWVNGYPSREVLRADVERGVSHLVEDSAGEPVGAFAFIAGPEPTYARIYQGSWLDDSLPYHVLHRIASTPGSRCVLAAIIAWCALRESNLRIDTHRDNVVMRHLLPRLGFTYCGIIYLTDGTERLAYQRL
ncbi:MAG: GNAT family N-acetyltransferase [Muribaculaceae bacterium]|nr:GNAT family N-acetyltransferase [Muribaculaceae bacterium]